MLQRKGMQMECARMNCKTIVKLKPAFNITPALAKILFNKLNIQSTAGTYGLAGNITAEVTG